jgi:NAD(P)-dependent dehydrogenase (short-subunit alcohol dehydrogenase family)
MTEVPAPTPWARIIGSSSGFGEATSLELARRGVNIFGVHFDRRATLAHVEEVIAAIAALMSAQTHWITGNVIRLDGGEDIVT